MTSTGSTLELVFCPAHWGPPDEDAVQTIDSGKLTVHILSDCVPKRELHSFNPAEKALQMFQYTWADFMSR